MTYIREFAVKNLKKNAVVEFYEYVMTLADKSESLKRNLPEQYAAMKEAADEVLKWGVLTLKSNLTAKIHDLDFQRDSYLISLEHTLKGLVTSLDPEIKEKATNVKNKYDSINVPRSAQYFQESGAIDRLLEALLGEELLSDVTAIGVLPILNLLKAANDEMHRLLVDRGIDDAHIPEQAFEKARRKAEAVYRDFVFMVNAYIAMYVVRANQPDADLENFVLNLNKFLHKYKITQFKSATKGEEAIIPPGEEDTDGETDGEDTGGDNTNPGGGDNINPGGGNGGSDNNPSNPNNPGSGSGSGSGNDNQEPVEVKADFMHDDGSEENLRGEPGTPLNAPEPDPGYEWEPTPPSVFPDHDTVYREVEIDNGEGDGDDDAGFGR